MGSTDRQLDRLCSQGHDVEWDGADRSVNRGDVYCQGQSQGRERGQSPGSRRPAGGHGTQSRKAQPGHVPARVHTGQDGCVTGSRVLSLQPLTDQVCPMAACREARRAQSALALVSVLGLEEREGVEAPPHPQRESTRPTGGGAGAPGGPHACLPVALQPCLAPQDSGSASAADSRTRSSSRSGEHGSRGRSDSAFSKTLRAVLAARLSSTTGSQMLICPAGPQGSRESLGDRSWSGSGATRATLEHTQGTLGGPPKPTLKPGPPRLHAHVPRRSLLSVLLAERPLPRAPSSKGPAWALTGLSPLLMQ